MSSESGDKRLVQHWRLVGAAAKDPDISKADSAVLWAILQMINRVTGTTFPSLETIAQHARVSPRSAPRSIKRLCALGYLHKTQRKGKGRDRSNVYRAGSVSDDVGSDRVVTDSAVTAESVPQSLTNSSLAGLTALSDIPASKSYQPQVPAPAEGPRANSQQTTSLALPVDPAIWAAFKAHHLETRRWSPSREHLVLGQLRGLIADGVDANAVLTWATVRGLADLPDAARRMAADAAKESTNANRSRPGTLCLADRVQRHEHGGGDAIEGSVRRVG